ncbi:MAG: 4-(cytidine 5'-diphospho)-2-C-methyl-D-erythritol kinase [Lachnospiraceae bacterium]|nr:4-(cytidine 5'-diphospho)-2-C-methyl-D-erythritol kinase [Lachnospiraceae bacterium]
MYIKAPAKINLSLDVTGKREDGYHLVSMIMMSVDLYDEVEVKLRADDEIHVKTDLDGLSDGPDNLAHKAAALMKEHAGAKAHGADISIKKHIPMAAGLAGGSTDAAAVMIALNELYNLGFSKEKLMDLSVKLGADCPFCILQGTALSEGIGEVLTPLKGFPPCIIAACKPPYGVSTKDAYEMVDSDESINHPNTRGMADDINSGDLKSAVKKMGNVLQKPAVSMHPDINDYIDCFLKEGALNSMMSGSGPTVYGIFDDMEKAKKALDSIKETYPGIWTGIIKGE